MGGSFQEICGSWGFPGDTGDSRDSLYCDEQGGSIIYAPWRRGRRASTRKDGDAGEMIYFTHQNGENGEVTTIILTTIGLSRVCMGV